MTDISSRALGTDPDPTQTDPTIEVDEPQSEVVTEAVARTIGIDRLLLLILCGLAVIAALDIAQSIVAPLVLALVFGVVVAPVADRLHHLGIPDAVTAIAILLLVLLALVLLILSLGPVLQGLIDQLPRIQSEVQSWLDTMASVMSGIDAISSQLEQTVGPSSVEGTDLPTVADALWLAPNIGGQVLIFAGSLFFFLLTRARIYEQVANITHRLYAAERKVAHYFAIVTLSTRPSAARRRSCYRSSACPVP